MHAFGVIRVEIFRVVQKEVSNDTSTKRVEVHLSRYLIRQDEGLPERVNATMLGGLGIDDFFALERGLRHCWPSKRVNLQHTAAEAKPDLPLEIAHLLLIDVVGYSKLLVNEQIELLQELKRIVRGTRMFSGSPKQTTNSFESQPETEWRYFFSEPGRAGAMRARHQQGVDRASAHSAAHGHPQRPGQSRHRR